MGAVPPSPSDIFGCKDFQQASDVAVWDIGCLSGVATCTRSPSPSKHVVNGCGMIFHLMNFQHSLFSRQSLCFLHLISGLLFLSAARSHVETDTPRKTKSNQLKIQFKTSCVDNLRKKQSSLRIKFSNQMESI